MFPVSPLEEGVVHDLLRGLPDPVLWIAEEAVDEVLGLRGDGRELRGEDEVLAPVHDLVVCLCGWRMRGGRWEGRGGKGRGWERRGGEGRGVQGRGGGERGEEEGIGEDGRGGEGRGGEKTGV